MNAFFVVKTDQSKQRKKMKNITKEITGQMAMLSILWSTFLYITFIFFHA